MSIGAIGGLRALVPYLAGGLLGLTVAGCGSTIPPYTINVPARLDHIRPPHSVAFVRDAVPLDGLQRAIEDAIPNIVEGDNKSGVLDFSWHLERQPVALHATPAGLAFEIAVAGKLAGQRGSVACHADEATITFRAEARPALRANGDIGFDHLDWKPTVRGHMRCQWVEVPMDSVLNFVTQPLAAALAKGLSKIDLPTGPLVRKGLAELASARTLTLDSKNKVCLDLAPDALVLSPIEGAGHTMILKLGVEVAPRLSLGACPAAATKAQPSRVVAKNVPLDDHFQIAVAVALPYLEIQKRVSPLLKGRRFGNADHGVTVDRIELGDANDRLLVKLAVQGTLNGDLYLWGTPSVVEDHGRYFVRIPDLQVAVETRSILEKAGLAIWGAVGDGLEGVLKEKLATDVTDQLTLARSTLSMRRELTAGPPSVVLTTKLDQIQPGDVSSLPGVLVIAPVLIGQAEVSLQD